MWYTKNDFHPIKNAADNQICQSHSVDEVANAKRGKSARLPSVFPPDWLSKSHEVFWPIKVLTEKKAIEELVLVLIESALFSTVTNSANTTTAPVRFFQTTTQALFSSYMLGVKCCSLVKNFNFICFFFLLLPGSISLVFWICLFLLPGILEMGNCKKLFLVWHLKNKANWTEVILFLKIVLSFWMV